MPVVSQCAADYLYSREKAAQTEQMFQRGENAYCQCVDKLKSGKQLLGTDFGNLILVMFDFHLRNAAHKNLTGKEGIDAYKMRTNFFFGKILLGKEQGPITKNDIVEHILQNWGIKIFSASPNSMFITSDHPAIWSLLTTPSTPPRLDLHLVSLPLTPKILAVTYNRRVVTIASDKISIEDEKTFNIGQIENSEQCVYASSSLPDELIATIQAGFARKTNLPSEVRETEWRFPLQHLPVKHHFSFIRLNPPLM